MFQQIVDYTLKIFASHIEVNSVKYKKRILINAQNNERYLQVICEDNAYFEFIKTNGQLRLILNYDVLGQPKNDSDTLPLQNLCFTVAAKVVAYIKNDYQYKHLLHIDDMSYLFLSNFTDDNSCGVRLTLEMVVPNPVDLCTYLDEFDFDNIEVEESDDIDLDIPSYSEEDSELNLNPIKLKPNSK